jgi:hypothetical protein
VRKVVAVLVVLLVAGAFVGGYWPQRQKLVRAEAEAAEARRQLAEARSELAEAEARERLARLFGRYLALRDAVNSGNFGEAQALSSPFFDAVREEVTREPGPLARAALDAILRQRDTITAGLARGEESVQEALVPVERELRRALGYPVPLAAAPAAPAAPRP